MEYPDTVDSVHETDDTSQPQFVHITPVVVEFNSRDKTPITVTNTNRSSTTTTLSLRAVVCELQPVTITEEVMQRKEEEELEKKRDEIVDDLAGH